LHHHRRGLDQLPGPGPAAADRDLGPDGRGRAELPSRRVVALDVPGRGDRARRAGVEPHRRLDPRRARSFQRADRAMNERAAFLPESSGRRGEPLLTVTSLRVAIAGDVGDLEAVRGVSFTLGRGETLGIVGESGSGKTLTALSVIGLLPHLTRITSGSILLE